MKWNKKISKAAEDHTKDIGPKGIFEHEGSDGCSPYDRVIKYGKSSFVGENLASGEYDGR